MTADSEKAPLADGERLNTKRWEKPRVEDVVVQPREDVLGGCFVSGAVDFQGVGCQYACMG